MATVVDKEEKRPNKRQKKQEQDEEISSTSSVQPVADAEKPEVEKYLQFASYFTLYHAFPHIAK